MPSSEQTDFTGSSVPTRIITGYIRRWRRPLRLEGSTGSVTIRGWSTAGKNPISEANKGEKGHTSTDGATCGAKAQQARSAVIPATFELGGNCKGSDRYWHLLWGTDDKAPKTSLPFRGRAADSSVVTSDNDGDASKGKEPRGKGRAEDSDPEWEDVGYPEKEDL